MNLGGVLAAISRASASRPSSVLCFGLVSIEPRLRPCGDGAGKSFGVGHMATGHANQPPVDTYILGNDETRPASLGR
jgi:hypothetical protein